MLNVPKLLGIAMVGLLVAALVAVVVQPAMINAPGALVPQSPNPDGSQGMVEATPSDAAAATPGPAGPIVAAKGPLGTGSLHTDGGNIVDAQGRVVHITGVNWFGLETGTFAPQGLWARRLNDMLDQIANAGFNTIRLPYSDELFDPNSAPNGIDFQKNPDLQGLSGLQIMDLVIQRAGERGLKIIVDRHRPDASGQSALWYTDKVSEQKWIDDWIMLASRYRGNPTVIGADLDNEPHGAASWGDGNPKTDWRAAAERAGNAVLQTNPDWLIFVEGIEHQGDDWYWWGGNLALAGQLPVELSAPDKLVYEAHDYGPGVNNQKWFKAPDFPQNLPSLWYAHWAYLKLSAVAPVLVGEFGGNSVGNDPEGVWQRTLISYLQSNGFDYTYWCWNPNSSDTGGILEDDWTTIDQAKLSLLQAYQWPLLGSPEPADIAQSIVAAYQPPSLPPESTSAAETGPSAPGRSFGIGGPFDPDQGHVLAGAGGPTDPDPAHREARRGDEERYLEQTGRPWDQAVYVTSAP
jgi:endoglucanase